MDGEPDSVTVTHRGAAGVAMGPRLSLAGADTSIIFVFCRDRAFFVATERLLSRQKYVLSRQNYVSRDKHVFVATKHVFCRDKSMLVATKLSLTTKLCLSRQNIFIATKNDTCSSSRQ